ncbi:hypothetical protein Taro_011873 [Colocasia esculenta]|uniref:Uncharacterized protein n=1 Tax=Colocasia esculenta TaxID=4460 RepID=A0A843UC36_COLES|nr:hypothetical protein [Colocasia esculenta]
MPETSPSPSTPETSPPPSAADTAVAVSVPGIPPPPLSFSTSFDPSRKGPGGSAVAHGCPDIAERNKQNCTHQNMTYRRGRTSIYQLKDDFVKTHQREPDRMEVFKMGRCKDLPDGTQRWVDDESRDRFEKMTQMTTPSLQSDDAAPVLAEDAFIAVMGRDRPGRVRCAGKAETLRTWYGRGEGSSSSCGYHTQVQQLQQQLQDQNKKVEELCAERSRDRQEL